MGPLKVKICLGEFCSKLESISIANTIPYLVSHIFSFQDVGTEDSIMGLSSTTPVNDGIQLCIFDLRRGQHEGQELDKILFFFPVDCPFSTQLSVVGLSEGLITFTR